MPDVALQINFTFMVIFITNTAQMVMKFLPQLSKNICYDALNRRLKLTQIDETKAFFTALRVPCESKSSIVLHDHIATGLCNIF